MDVAASLTAQLDGLRRTWRGFWPQADLDALARDVAARRDAAVAAWRLEHARPLPGGQVAAVVAAERDGLPVVLKVAPRGHADDAQLAGEGAALRFWGPTGAVPRVLDSADGGLTLLLERVVPGTALDDAGLPWEERLTALGTLAARLHRAPGAPPDAPRFPAYAPEWPALLAGDPELRALWRELTAPRPDDVLIHADLHGANALLAADGGWLAIDPHAVLADRHADVWALIDPLAPALPADRDAAARTARGWLARYADAAGLDHGRAAAWTRLRARATALELEAGEQLDDGDAAWARRLRRTADALV